jgi:hypothetical protein
MAEQEEVFRITVETGNSTKKVKDLKDETNELAGSINEVSESSEELSKQQDTLAKSTDKAATASKQSGGAFSSLKNIIAGLGIVGAISALFDVFKTALGKNQKVADTVAAVMDTIANVMSKVIEVVTQVIDKVSQNTNGFEKLGKVIGGLITLALTPLKGSFYAISLALAEAQLLWEESFFGDNDPKAIKALNERIDSAKKGLEETAKAAVKSGKDVVTNFVGAIGEAGQLVNGVYKGVSEISVSSIYQQSKATVALKNNAKLAAAALQGIVEEYDRQAELQRQIRDDETRSIEERIAANNKLGEVLKEQQKAALGLADQRIAAAAAELSANSSSIDLQVALKEAQNERAAVLAQIAGFESEQIVNGIALNKELLELSKSRAENEANDLLERKKASANLIQDELLRAETLNEIRKGERDTEFKRLQSNIDATKEGTLARVEAENAYRDKKRELDLQDIEADKQINDIKLQRAIDYNNARYENDLSFFEIRRLELETERMSAFARAQELMNLAKEEAEVKIAALNAQRDAEIAAAEKVGLDTTEIKRKYAIEAGVINAEIAKSEEELKKAKISATVEAADAVAATLNTVANLLGQNTGVGKALAIVSTTISTISAAQKAYESTVGIPFVGPILAPINAAAAIASGIASVNKIKSVKVPGGGGSSAGTSIGGIQTPRPAQAPIGAAVQVTNTQSLGTTDVNVQNQGAIKAFVVESDITDSQDRISKIKAAATL